MSRSTKGRKCTETTGGDSKHADEPSNCIICLEKVACRGKLSVCNHWFCFPCILEWSENTNTCPICKARFRCITKVHLSPFRSPPTKVRIGDRDQRVWNDDDSLVAEDILAAIDSDDVDDDYEPPNQVANPWTRNTRQQNDRTTRRNPQTSRQLHLDDYDYEDSFIDDTDEALQAYLHATYSREALDLVDNGGDGSDSGGSSDDSVVEQRTSPYRFRNRHAAQRSSRNTRNTFDSLPQIEEESPCPSPASTGSFMVSDDESPDELNSNWVPFGNHSNNSRNKGKSKVKAKKNDSTNRRSSETSRTNRPSTSRKSQPLHRPKKQQEPNQRCRKSKRKRQKSASEDDFEQGTSSRSRSKTNQTSIDGWISMASERTKAHPSTSSTTNPRTVRERACKGKKPVDYGESCDELYDSSSDSEVEVLSVRINQGGLKPSRNRRQEKKNENALLNHDLSGASFSTRVTRNKQQQQHIASASTSTSIETHEDACSITSEDEDDFSKVAFIQPTPQPDKKRSIFTRRQHRSPNASFDRLEDYAKIAKAKNISSHRRTDTALADKSNIPLEMSPLVKKKKPLQKRVRKLSSDSE